MNPALINPVMMFWFCITEDTLLTLLDINDELMQLYGVHS